MSTKKRSRKIQKKKALSKADIQNVFDAKIVSNDSSNIVQYQLLLSDNSISWTKCKRIAPQTRKSSFFSTMIEQCDNIPDDLSSHRELVKRARFLLNHLLSLSIDVTVNEDVSSLIMFQTQYNMVFFKEFLLNQS